MMMTRRWFSLLLFLALVAPAGAATDKRYVSPSGAFSISMNDIFVWKPGPEDVSGTRVVVDFSAVHIAIPLLMERTVEWIGIAKPLDPSEYDFQANAVVNGYLQGRFGDKLAVADRSKSRDSEGRLVYTFAAKGDVGNMPAFWQGTVLIFDSGVALVSEIIAQPTQHRFAPDHGVIWPEAVAWARTLRPGQ